MKRFASILSAILIAATASVVTAQQSVAAPKVNAPAIFPLEDLRPGMKGTARTVFNGSDTQEFGVEILGVLPGFPGPRQSAIIGKLTGPNVEKTGVFAGMSGSPVYVDGKIIGAIAFSFPFSKEPIAGITPIKQMIDLFDKGAENQKAKPKEPRPVSFSQLAGTDWKPNLPKPAVSPVSLLTPVAAGSPLLPLLGQQMAPIATPLVFSGISQDSLSMFAPQLVASGLLPVSGAGGSAAITPLAKVNGNTFPPGSSISVQLVRGDYSLAAAGTVTMRDGDRIYAFGHPFLSLGASD
ncbi:MAG TPA: SpoIVB peptidase S55 domain-containing protein, partial [Pyrinomonadaceae bacterium]|nr:SpoIVB peptidase S55 domain-containing protein [Pyrinomonadaceae bacterium]